MVRWFEATEIETKKPPCVENPNKAIFTHMCWDYKDQELYVSDEKGHVFVINVYDEERFFKKRLVESKINRIEIVPNARYLLVMTDYDITSFRIKKGVKTHDMEGHIDAILKIVVLEPQRMIKAAEEKIPDTPKVITCSLDNTILLWDFDKLEIITKMEAPENSEISCMTFLYNCCLVATGHEDGAIRLWNLEINSSVLLKSHESKKHNNSISCIYGAIWKECEFLLCGGYDGKVSIWEISEKKGAGSNSSGSTIFPQMRSMIDNNLKNQVTKNFPGNEVLVLNFWEKDMNGEGYILMGGNFQNIEVYSMRTGQHETTLRGHTDSVTCMTKDSYFLFTGSDDFTIIHWNMYTWTKIGIIGSHEERKYILTLVTSA